MRRLFVSAHLGLGDALVYNGMIRVLAKRTERLTFPCKGNNLYSVRFMFKDMENLEIIECNDQNECMKFADFFEQHFGSVLRLGLHSATAPKFDEWKANWAEHMYWQADVDWHERWDSFYVKRVLSDEKKPPLDPFILVHDDHRKIDMKRVRRDMDIVKVHPTGNIFDWCKCIERAEEIHCINSSVAILADSIPTVASKLVYHDYARPEIGVPTPKKNWEHYS